MNKLKVLIADDTVTYRRILTEVVNSFPNAEVIATANNGKIALAKIKHDPPDIVLLDMVMPEMDGLEALVRIGKEHPQIGVIMISGSGAPQAADTLKALQLGAIDFVSKPEGLDLSSNFQELKERLRPLLSLFITRRYTKGIGLGGSHPEGSRKEQKAGTTVTTNIGPGTRPALSRIGAVVIGVSTGGPNALAEVIPKLSADLRVPVLLVQHMPPLFTASLAEHLGKRSALKVVEARDGELVTPGVVFIAPGGKHMFVDCAQPGNGTSPGKIIRLSDAPPVNSCRPSVDVLFRSVAVCYPGKTLAVIMTGMGEDGAQGVRALREKGSYCLAQNEETCVVYGMPRAIVEAGLADEILPLERIAARICDLVGN